MKTIPFVGASYKDDTRPFDQQSCINYIPEMSGNQNARSPALLRGVPGLKKQVDAGDGAVRGLHDVEGTHFMVRGTTLYEVKSDWTLVSRGTVSGAGRVSMTHNTFGGGYQMTIVNGLQGYVYNTNTQVLTQITATAFPGSIICDYIDSYTVHVAPDLIRWFNSELADATQFSSTDFYEAEASPDSLISLLVDHLEVWLFGTRSIEIWQDNPTETAVFQRAQGIFIEQGCAATYSPASLDNGIFWFGNDGKVYRSAGYTPVVVSTPSIEQAMAGLDWSKAFSMVWSDRGHKVYYLSFPDGPTFGYDVSTQLWHQRKSYNQNNWRVSALSYWNGQWVAGDALDGRLYTLDWNTFAEDDMPLVAERTSPYMTDAQNRLFQSAMEFVMDTGQGALNGDNYLNLAYSDDGGRNYSNWKQRSLGAVGQYGLRVQFYRLGSFRNRLFRLQVSSPVKRDLIAVSASFQEAA